VAKRAGTSHHKARQAIATNKGVEDGTVSAADKSAVIAGEKKLRDVAPKAGSKKARSKPPVEVTFDQEVARAWDKLKQKFAATEYPDVRRIVKRLIAAEEKAVA
jgi:hypothetical protein